jgi:hypothetical protein
MTASEKTAGRAGGTASATLSRLAEEADEKGGLTISDALDLMGRAGFGFVMLILALPALIPIPGPFGMVFGSALALCSLQFAIGLRSLWLPSILGRRKVSARAFASMHEHASPMIRRIEKIIRPDRLKAFAGRRMPFILALPVFCLAVAVALPIPFGNLAPVAAICVIAIGLIERDGLVVLIGLVLTLIALMVTAALLYAAAGALAWI